jgi:hypothetical protein
MRQQRFIGTNLEGGGLDGFENKILEYHLCAITVFARGE